MNVKTGMILWIIKSGSTLAMLDISNKAACCTWVLVVVRKQSIIRSARTALRSIGPSDEFWVKSDMPFAAVDSCYL